MNGCTVAHILCTEQKRQLSTERQAISELYNFVTWPYEDRQHGQISNVVVEDTLVLFDNIEFKDANGSDVSNKSQRSLSFLLGQCAMDHLRFA